MENFQNKFPLPALRGRRSLPLFFIPGDTVCPESSIFILASAIQERPGGITFGQSRILANRLGTLFENSSGNCAFAFLRKCMSAWIQEEIMARLTLEIPDDTHRRLKTLAAYFGMSMKDFLISRALAPAERSTPPSGLPEVNADAERLDHLLFSPEATFKLSPENWEAFQAALDAPPSPNAALRKLMTTPTRFDEP